MAGVRRANGNNPRLELHYGRTISNRESTVIIALTRWTSKRLFCKAFQPGLSGGGRRSGIVVRLSALNYRDWQDVLCILVPDVLSPETRRVAPIRRLQLL